MWLWMNLDTDAHPAGPPTNRALVAGSPRLHDHQSPDSTWQTPVCAELNRATRPEHSQLVTTVLTHVSQRQDFRLFVGVDYPRISSASDFGWEAGCLFLGLGGGGAEHTPV